MTSLATTDVTSDEGVTIEQAAERLGVTPAKITYAVANGAPTVRRGGKGRGNATLVDPAAIRTWFEDRSRPRTIVNHDLALARELTADVAAAFVALFRAHTGPGKRAFGAQVLQQFYVAMSSVYHRFDLPPPTLEDLPADIRQMAAAVSTTK